MAVNACSFGWTTHVSLAFLLWAGNVHAQPSDLGIARPTARTPGPPTRLGIGWSSETLVLDMTRGARFELLQPIDGQVPVCGVDPKHSGGLAIFWRDDKVVEYGCWRALQRGTETWAQFEMNSGIAVRMPLRAFSRRPIRE